MGKIIIMKMKIMAILVLFQYGRANDHLLPGGTELDNKAKNGLKEMLKMLHKNLGRVQHQNDNCGVLKSDSRQTAEQALLMHFQFLTERLGDPKGVLTCSEVSILFRDIDHYLYYTLADMKEHLMSQEAYNSENRFKDAFESERKSAHGKCSINMKKVESIKWIHQCVEMEVLNGIRQTLSDIMVAESMRKPDVQRRYHDHFTTYYFTKEDLDKQLVVHLDKQLDVYTDNAEKIPECWHGSEKAIMAACLWCALTDKEVMSQYACLNSDFVQTAACLITPICWLGTLIGGLTIALPYDMVNFVRRRFWKTKYHRTIGQKQKLQLKNDESNDNDKAIVPYGGYQRLPGPSKTSQHFLDHN